MSPRGSALYAASRLTLRRDVAAGTAVVIAGPCSPKTASGVPMISPAPSAGPTVWLMSSRAALPPRPGDYHPKRRARARNATSGPSRRGHLSLPRRRIAAIVPHDGFRLEALSSMRVDRRLLGWGLF